MPEDLTFDQRLRAIQSSLVVPKNRKNTFGGYSYRSAEDILDAVKPLLREHELNLILSDDIVEVGGRIYVKATATVYRQTTVPAMQPQPFHEKIDVTAFAREEETKKGMDAAQITGSASSYARKYALNGLFLIDDDKDADTDEHHRVTHPIAVPAGIGLDEPDKWGPGTGGGPELEIGRTKPHAEQPITDQQKRQIFALSGEIAEAKGWAKDWVKDDLYAFFQVGSTTNLTTAQAAKAIAALYQVKDKNAVFADALQSMKGA